MHRRDFLKQVSIAAALLGIQQPIGQRGDVTGAPRSLLWYVEDWSGRVVSKWQADRPANPASVTKLATSLMALNQYSSSYRYSTSFTPQGVIDAPTGFLQGNLHVQASGDPDFQFENAVLVAAHLNRLGIKEVGGNLIIHGPFHLGWNNGWVPTNSGQWRRYIVGKGSFLRRAWDCSRWRHADLQAWEDLRQHPIGLQQRNMLDGFRGLKIQGRIRPASPTEAPRSSPSVIHQSNPLLRILKRFNSYSNNDIERIGHQLGGPRALRRFLIKWLRLPVKTVRFSSTSGLGANRLSPRATVQVVRSLIELGKKQQFVLTDILPVAGTDEGTLEDRFADPQYKGSIVAKSGQLVRTDGGVSTLSGLTCTQRGPLLFAIFHLRTYRHLNASRDRVDRTLTKFIDQMGGPAALPYQPQGSPSSYDQIRIDVVQADSRPGTAQ